MTKEIKQLVQSIGYPRNGSFEHRAPTESKDVLQAAEQNKVASLYLRSLHDQGALDKLTGEFEKKQQYQSDFQRTSRRISQMLSTGEEFALVKSIHPFPADASDVDVVLFDDPDLHSLGPHLEEQGYHVLGIAPSAMTIRDETTGQLVDLQTFFGLHKVVYYDMKHMRDNVVNRKVDGDVLSVPARPYDLSLIVNHSVTELMFLLKEYYATVFMLETSDESDVLEFVEDVRFNDSVAGCQAFLAIVDWINSEFFSIEPKHMDLLRDEIGISSHEREYAGTPLDFPHRYSRLSLTRFTVEKFKQPAFRGSFVEELPSFVHPSTAAYILRKVYGRSSRETY
ncbi:hypothetical protein SAMN05216559_0358 [Halomicrobium zhouii]|uniref:Nucleotidyltransferase n=1 Tax=Halomicrobium zhouii TaxID=767519 RepID=A0A1I6K8B4_9EURY|nr:hypothetical protein [Halomicrobium zhouii]SFR87459.1 hypothetical protein SAMN05216559_0358 [Halomicrobium zhouii]